MATRAFQSSGIVNTIVDVVADFYADPTGSVDATTAFQNAINSLQTSSATRGGKIHVPAGTYKLSGTLTFTSYLNVNHNMYLEGDGSENTYLDFSSTVGTHDGISFNMGAFFGIKGITINAATGNGISINIGQTGTANFSWMYHLENVRVQFCGGSGIKTSNSYMGTLIDCWCTGNAASGFEFDGYHTSIAATRCWGGGSASYPTGGNNSYGWLLNQMTYSSFTACGADYNTQNGYFCSNLVGVTFDGCGTESNQKEGWYVATGVNETGISAPYTGVHGLVFNGCFAYSNGMANAGAGTYSNFIGANAGTGTSSRSIDIVVNGGSAYCNATTDHCIVANAASNNVTIKVNGFYPQNSTTPTLTTGSSYATITDFSGIWDNFYIQSTNTTSIGLTNTIVTYNSIVSGNVQAQWTAGSFSYAVASTGTYQISASVKTTSTAAGDAMGLILYINGSRYADGIATAAQGIGNPLPSIISASVPMTAGQTIQIQAVSSGHATAMTGTATNNWLSISRIA